MHCMMRSLKLLIGGGPRDRQAAVAVQLIHKSPHHNVMFAPRGDGIATFHQIMKKVMTPRVAVVLDNQELGPQRFLRLAEKRMKDCALVTFNVHLQCIDVRDSLVL